MKQYKAGDLEINITEEDDERVKINWLGVSNARDPAVIINPIIDKITAELDCKEVTIDFTDLEYINSSTVPPIVRLIKEIHKKSIKTYVAYDHSSKWQQESFRALGTLAKVLRNVVIVE